MSFLVDSFEPPAKHGAVVMVHKGWQSSKRPTTSGLTNQAQKAGKPPKAGTLSQAFQFVNATDASQSRNPKTRKLIKAHVVKDAVRQKRVLAQQRAKLKPKPITKSPLGVSDSVSISISNQSDSGSTSQDGFALIQSLDPHPRLSGIIHHINKIASAMYPLESKFKFNPLSAAPWFDFALSDDALLNAMLYTTAAYTGLLEGTTESKAAMMRMNRSVVLVNERLRVSRTEIEDGTVGAVSCLAITEALRGNFDGWNMHMAGLKQLVEVKGGFTALNETLRLKILRADLVGTVDFIANPHFQFQRSTRSTSRRRMPTFDVESVEGLISSMIKARVNPRLIAIFNELHQFSRSCEEIFHHPPSSIEEVAFIEDVYELRYELVLLKFPDLNMEARIISEALRIGALIFMKETLQEYPVSAVGSENMLQRLKDLLVEIVGCDALQPFIVWLLFMGGLSSRSTLDRTWFVAQLTRLSAERKLMEWGYVKSMLESVLWIKSIHGSIGMRLWEEVEISRAILIVGKII